MTKEYQNYVNGEWKSSVNQIEILSPIDDSSLGFVPAMTREEVDHAMKAGREALPAWAA
ncbi:TPA: NADP-dependent glyceraldehyde-3-phosphate dehydrogenase, partial [Streptococcus agalactiae]